MPLYLIGIKSRKNSLKILKWLTREDFAYLCHYHVLALLHIFAICLHDGLQESQVLHMPAVGLNAVYKVLHHPLADLVAQQVIIHEDVPHGLSFQELNRSKTASWVRQICFQIERCTGFSSRGRLTGKGKLEKSFSMISGCSFEGISPHFPMSTNSPKVGISQTFVHVEGEHTHTEHW